MENLRREKILVDNSEIKIIEIGISYIIQIKSSILIEATKFKDIYFSFELNLIEKMTYYVISSTTGPNAGYGASQLICAVFKDFLRIYNQSPGTVDQYTVPATIIVPKKII